MTPTQTQAALLSDDEINARICASEVHEYHPGAILELVRELEQDILSKLKPPPSMLTNDELIDLAVEHGLGRKIPPLGLNTGNVFYTDNSYRTSALLDFADAHEQAVLARLPANDAAEPVAWRWMPSQVFKFWQYSDDKARVEEARKFMGDGGVQALYICPPAQAILAKLQATQEPAQAPPTLPVEVCDWCGKDAVAHVCADHKPAQAGELPDERDEFERWYVDQCPDILCEPIGSRLFAHQWDAWQARAALAARKPLSNAQSQLEALEDLIEDLSEWSRHVIEDTAPATLEKHVREVLKRHGINGLEVKT